METTERQQEPTQIGDAFGMGQRMLSSREQAAGRAFAQTIGRTAGTPKHLVMRQMHWLFDYARLAYQASKDTSKSEDERLLCAAAFAYQFSCLLDDIAANFKTMDETVAKLQQTSDWFKSKGWSGIPEFYEGDELHMKRAPGMISDMQRFREAGQRYQSAVNDSDEAGGRKERAA